MYCGSCGKELRDGAKFCDECGAIQPDAIPESQKPKTAPEAVQPDVPVMLQPDVIRPLVPVIPVVETPKKEKKKVNKKILAIVAIVLVLAVTAAIVIPIFFPGKETIYVMTSMTLYDADGNKTGYYVYECDEVGNFLSAKYDQEVIKDPIKGNTYEFDGKFQIDYEAEFNEKGNYLRWQYSYSLGNSIEYEYDDDGRIIEFTLTTEPSLEGEYNETSKLEPVTYYCEYDKNDRLVRVYTSNEDYDEFIVQLYEYDEDGRLTAAYSCTENGAGRNDLSYKNGRLSKNKYYECSVEAFQSGDDSEYELIYTSKFEFDKEGNLTIVDLVDADGNRINRNEWVYNNKGHKEEYTETQSDGAKYTYEYTCDKHGNIIEIKNPDGSRVEYEYKELEVTIHQAIRYHRRQEDTYLYGYYGNDWYITNHLLPSLIAEQE